MENCLICQQDLTDAPGYCLNCHWPTGFNSKLRNSQIDAAVVRWSAQLYQEYLKLTVHHPGTTQRNPATDQQGLETKIQQLSQGLKTLNDACIQERQYFDLKLSTLANEVEFLKARVPDSSNFAARINNIEEQQVRLLRDIAILRSQLADPVMPGVPEFSQQPVAVGAPNVVMIESNEVKIELIPAEEELIKQYNHYIEIPESIRQGAEDVSLDSGALNRLRDGDISNTSFVTDRKGNFLMVPRNGFQYLVPNKKRPINSHIHKTVKFIYTCQGYYEDYVQLLLVKPAIVREVNPGQWQLSQPGILQFK